MSIKSAITMLAGVAILSAACSDQSEPTAPVTDLYPGIPSEQLAPNVPAEQVLARLLALALRDPDLRQEFKRATDESPVVSGKLFFAEYLRQNGSRVLNEMVSRGRVPESYISRRLAEMPDLEIYLPVDEHRIAWTGGSDIIVAASLTEDEAPFGIRLDGRSVQLSATEPPSTPVIAIVPAESFGSFGMPFSTDLKPTTPLIKPSFGLAPTEPSMAMIPDACTYQGGETPTYQRGLDVEEFMVCVRAYDDHEPWWKDDAEFSLMFAGTTDFDAESEYTNVINIPPYVWSNSGGKGSWKRLPTPIKVGWWQQNLGSRIYFRCIERDGGGTHAFSLTGSTELPVSGDSGPKVTVGFEYSYNFSDGDDNCGTYYTVMRRVDDTWTLIPNGTSPVYEGTSDLQWAGFGVQR